MRIYYFFVGGCKISSKRTNAEDIINICMKNGIFYRDFIFSKDGECIQFDCSFYAAKFLINTCRSSGIDICVKASYGIPHILKKYNKRYGLLLGMILALFIIWLSGRYVWDVRISGCNTVDENVVIDHLKSQGLFIGSRINGLDIDAIENKVLIKSPEISWIAVNMRGCVAYVEIREKLIFNENINSDMPANIVAKCDAQIELIEAYAGEPKVIVGQHVNKGELLISGIYDSASLGYRCVRAKGNVWAKTVRTLNVEIPYQYSEKTYIDECTVENSIIFFSKKIKLLENTGFLGTTYDTIYKTNTLSLPGKIKLPLTQKKTVYMYYEYQDKVRTIEDATELAFEELDSLIQDISGENVEVLRKNIVYNADGTSFKLKCTLVLRENIAEIMEFTIDN